MEAKARRTFRLSICIVLVIATGAAALVYCVRHFVYVPFGYSLVATFAKLPPDDERLTEWLKVQPGVSEHTVLVQRIAANNQTLKVIFVQVHNSAHEPALPDLDAQCAAMGYHGQEEPFRIRLDE